jgi:hypothetical protein
MRAAGHQQDQLSRGNANRIMPQEVEALRGLARESARGDRPALTGGGGAAEADASPAPPALQAA